MKIAGRVKCFGTVNLVLCDGASLTASKGIEVSSGAMLRVYGQEKATGKLAAIGKARNAGIGAYQYGTCGTIEIHGGAVTATGGESGGAGIGGGVSGSGGTVTVYGGAVTATGGSDGAGIGGGRQGSGANVTIYGGAVMATGVGDAEGIGCGANGTASGTLTLKGDVRLLGCANFLEWVEWDASSTDKRPREMSTAYTVSFDANGHGTAPEAQVVRTGQAAEKPADPTEAGYAFGGWFTDPECKSAYDFTTKITVAVKLYAKWEDPAPLPIDGAKVTLAKTSYAYDGAAKEPAVVSVVLDGKTLAAGTDYEVSYAGNVGVGTATATVTGKGNYAGSATAAFSIALARPALKTVAKPSKRRFLAKWGAVAGAEGYELQWRARGGSWKTVRTGTTSTTVGKAKPGKSYQFRVRAVPPSGASAWSGLKSRWLKKAPAVTGKAAGKGCVKVRWKAVAKASGGYVAYARYSKKGKVVAKVRVGRGKTSVKISGLESGRKVWVSVRPVKSVKGKGYAGILRRAAKGVKVK